MRRSDLSSMWKHFTTVPVLVYASVYGPWRFGRLTASSFHSRMLPAFQFFFCPVYFSAMRTVSPSPRPSYGHDQASCACRVSFTPASPPPPPSWPNHLWPRREPSAASFMFGVVLFVVCASFIDRRSGPSVRINPATSRRSTDTDFVSKSVSCQLAVATLRPRDILYPATNTFHSLQEKSLGTYLAFVPLVCMTKYLGRGRVQCWNTTEHRCSALMSFCCRSTGFTPSYCRIGKT